MRDEMDRDFWDEVMAASWIEDAVLHHAGDTVHDGKIDFADRETKVLAIENNTLLPDDGGRAQCSMIFYLPRTVTPAPGDRLTYRERLYDLKTVQTCKDLDGKVTAYRCSAV